MTEKVRVQIWAELYMGGRNILEFERKEWDAMTEEEKEEALAEDIYSLTEQGWYVMRDDERD